MNRIIIILALAVLAFVARAQDFGIAVLFDRNMQADQITKHFNDNVENMILNDASKNLLLYNWDPKNHTVKFSPNNKVAEKPSRAVIFVKSDGFFLLNPELQIKKDSAGKVTEAFFLLNSSLKYYAKQVDLKTSKVMFNKVIELDKKNERKLAVTNLQKYYGPKAKKSSDVSKDIKADYKEAIENAYKNEFFVNVELKDFTQRLLTHTHGVFEVLPQPGLKDKKVKKISFKGSRSDNLIKKDNYKVFMKKQIGKYHYYDDLATMYVDEIGDSVSTASTLLFGDKDLAKELSNSTPLIMVKEADVQEINRLNINPGTPEVRIAFKKDGIFSYSQVESMLYNNPTFSLIERNAPELRYFANLAKDENFIDYSLDEIQSKQQGYELLMTESGKYFQVTEIKTTKTICNLEKNYVAAQANSFTPGNELESSISKGHMQRILSSYKPEDFKVQIVEIMEEKKGKTEKLAVYHPAGMERNMEYIIYTLAKENVDDEEVLRKNKIAWGRIGKIISPCIAELNIKDGEKELFALMQNKEDIHIEISDKTK